MGHPLRPSPVAAALALVALGVLVLITFLAGLSVVAAAPALAREFPEYAHLQVPLTCAALGLLVCIVAALVLIAALVWAVQNGRILEEGSQRLVDALVVPVLVGAACCVFGWVFVPGPPPLGLAVSGAAFAAISLALIVVVLRSLLRQASAMRLDREAVI